MNRKLAADMDVSGAPFTPEVDSGGWMVAGQWLTDDYGRPHYWLDPDHHPVEVDDQIAGNITLIAAAPRMYRVLKALLDTRTRSDDEVRRERREARYVIDWIDAELTRSAPDDGQAFFDARFARDQRMERWDPR